jgi:stress-induced morphogen
LFRDTDDYVDVSDGQNAESVHVVIVSRKFDGLRMQQKHDMIWDELQERLTPEEWSTVTLSVGVSPEDLKVTL